MSGVLYIMWKLERLVIVAVRVRGDQDALTRTSFDVFEDQFLLSVRVDKLPHLAHFEPANAPFFYPLESIRTVF